MNENQQLEQQISDVQDKNSGLEQTQAQGTKEEKTYSKEEVSDIVEKRLNRERAKLEKQFNERLNALEEAQKLQAMDEQQKAEYQAKKERDAFEEERKAFYAERDAFNHAKYKQTIEQQLQAKGLPVDMADLLTNLTAEEVASKISSMEQSFNSQINSSIEARVKASASVPTTPQKEAQGLLTLEQIKSLSANEMAQNKELVQKSLQALNQK